MAGKKKEALVETIEQKSAKLLSVRVQIKDLEKAEAELVEALRAHVKETGEKDIGGLLAYEKTGMAKLEGLENKALNVAKEQLINELNSTYVKKSLDVNKMYAAMQTDRTLFGHLAQKGLTITQSLEVYFKAVN